VNNHLHTTDFNIVETYLLFSKILPVAPLEPVQPGGPVNPPPPGNPGGPCTAGPGPGPP